MKTTVWLFVVLTGACGAVTLFEDDFDDGNADGWTEYSTNPDSASYYVEGGWYHMELSTVGQVSAYNGNVEGTSPHQMSVSNYSFVCKAVAISGIDHMGFTVRMQPPISEENGYVMWLRYTSNDVVLFLHTGGITQELDRGDLLLESGAEYWIRVEIFDDLIRGKVWQGDLADEPEAFLVSANDGSFTEPGSIGMLCHSYNIATKHGAFDNVMVTDTAYDLAPFTWGGIKGSF